MKPLDALLIEGTDEHSILSYGIYDTCDLEAAQHAFSAQETHEAFVLHDEGWPNGVILLERRVTRETVIEAISQSLNAHCGLKNCKVALCLYDGAFTTYGDLLSAEIANKTYAVAIDEGQLITALDEPVLNSQAWRDIIAGLHARVS